VSEKKFVLDTERGIIAHYCAIPPSQPPFIAYKIAQNIFPTTPFIAIKYWQYLVRANIQAALPTSWLPLTGKYSNKALWG